jgi:aminopeptidase YwaD
MNQEPVRLDPQRISRTLDDIAEIGNRFAGSPGESACREYLLGRFEELDVAELRLEAFSYLGFERAGSSCSAQGLEGLELESHPLQYTSGSPVNGEAVYLGAAGEEDFARIDRAGVDLAGKIVVAHAIFPFELCDELQRRRIAGFVHICETPAPVVGNFTGALYPPPLQPPWAGRPQPYAGVTIGDADGRALLSAMTCGGPLRISVSHEGAYAEAVAHNLVAELPGTGDGDEHVIVSAHYDSQAEGPCVYDNGTGLAALLECARVLGGSGVRRRIVLIASACEEIGVWGATAYTHAHADELGAAAAMVNLDGLASAYPAEREIWSADATLAAMAQDTARELGWIPDRVMNVRSTFSDHAPFGDAGVPSCLIWRPEYPYYHSRGDVRELVDAAAVAETGSVSATLISRLARGADVSAEPASAT